jgi:hypothetical protein
LIDVADGTEKLRIPADKRSLPKAALFSPDGKRLAIGLYDLDTEIWDPNTGKVFCVLEESKDVDGNFAFSPDGKLLAATTRVADRRGPGTDNSLWDVESGKRIRRFATMASGAVMRFSFSEDGQTVAAEHRVLVKSERVSLMTYATYETSVHLWDTATGKDLGQVGTRASWSGPMVAAPRPGAKFAEVGAVGAGAYLTGVRHDYRTACARPSFRVRRDSKDNIILMPPSVGLDLLVTNSHDGGITLFRARTGHEVAKLTVFQQSNVFIQASDLSGVALSPDGAWLAACGRLPKRAHFSIFLWDLSGLPKSDPAKELKTSPADLNSWWADLAAAAATVAHPAMRRFLAVPSKTLEFLGERLPPADRSDGILKWIDQLDSDEARTREAASQQLTRAGLAARRDLDRNHGTTPILPINGEGLTPSLRCFRRMPRRMRCKGCVPSTCWNRSGRSTQRRY